MPEVLGMSDRIIVMHEGHLSGEFTREAGHPGSVNYVRCGQA
ncbi:hypothetical protein ACLB1N_24480 [Escherichia coli]